MDTTRLRLVEQVTNMLLGLTSEQLTTLLCTHCYERYTLSPDVLPSVAYQEKSGICSYCFEESTVSNPYLNRFLRQPDLLIDQACCDVDADTALIQNWLLPVNYLRQRRIDLCFGETEAWTWIEHGVATRRAIRDSKLNEEDKRLLQAFYSQCYTADRFSSRNERNEDCNGVMKIKPRPAQPDAKAKSPAFLFLNAIDKYLKLSWKGEKR